MEEFEKIKQKLVSDKAESLSIYRVPKRCNHLFKDFANENFAGDYGAALAFFVYNHLDFPISNKDMYGLLTDLSQRVEKIEEIVSESQSSKNNSVKKNLLGKPIGSK
jgi:hypothetical protein